ncbi:MAG: undecaprenyldiphospho-muramoylpentapeptide beta-N-acetylglucosaminyltransferase [Pseudomonadota bacterium]
MKKLLLCGGGTGGHLFPAVAVAEEWQAMGGEVLFVGSGRKTEKDVLSRLGFPWRGISVVGLRGRGLRGAAGLLKLPVALKQSVAILRRFRPDVVLGVGGYSSGPVIVAARLFFGVPCALQEQNAEPGLTNRLLGRLVRRAFVSFPETERFFAGAARLTGNPVRRALLRPQAARQAGRLGVLMFGGSLGAHSLNVAGTAMLPHLVDLKGGLDIMHQTGERDLAQVRAGYEAAGFSSGARVASFIHDMAEAYGSADVVICRAGATTLAELAALGKASILVPYPHATGNHQELNARAFERAGAAEVVLDRALDPRDLAGRLRALLTDAPRRERMATAARALARPEAARTIVQELRVLAAC